MWLIILKFAPILIISSVLFEVQGACVKDGYVATGHGISCQVVDHKIPDADSRFNSSYDCITTLKNSIHVHVGGDVTFECFAKFPLEVNYDGVQPAVNIEVEFFKRGLEFKPNPETDLYVIAIRLNANEHSIWSANYLFHGVGKPWEVLMVSIFVHKPYLPFFLPLSEDTLNAYLDPRGKYLILPCRVQNYDLEVQLFQEYVPVELDDTLKFDPKIGFIREIVEDVDPYGEYECYTEFDGREDRQKVVAKELTGDVVLSPKPQDESKDNGQLKFVKTNRGTTTGMCLATKEKLRKNKFASSFVNSEFNNPNTFKLKTGCLHDKDEYTGRMCPGRKLGRLLKTTGMVPYQPMSKIIPFDNITEFDDLYEIKAIHQSGGIQCGNTRREYFTGIDNTVYIDYRVAKENNALVKVIPAHPYTKFVLNGWYGFNCNYVIYIAVSPVWWILKFADGTIQQDFGSNSTARYFELSEGVSSVICRVSAWNSSEWFENEYPIALSEPDPFEKPIDTGRIYFKLHAEHQILPCKASGMPAPSIKWLKDGQEDKALLTTLNEDTLRLIFPKVSKNDEGTYTCSVHSNDVGIEITFTVYVLEDENPTSDDTPCTTITTLHPSATQKELLTTSSIHEGESIYVRATRKCPKGDIGSHNFTALVAKIDGKAKSTDDEAPTDTSTNDEDEQDGNATCTSTVTLISVESGEEIPLSSIKKGDNIVLHMSECSDSDSGSEGSEVDVTVDVTAVDKLKDEFSNAEGQTKRKPWYLSLQAIALWFLLLCLLFIIILICFIYYFCVARHHKIYYVNR